MKPHGREKNYKGGPWKRNVKSAHKRLGNWWESIIQPISRSSMNVNWMREVLKELEEKDNHDRG